MTLASAYQLFLSMPYLRCLFTVTHTITMRITPVLVIVRVGSAPSDIVATHVLCMRLAPAFLMQHLACVSLLVRHQCLFCHGITGTLTIASTALLATTGVTLEILLTLFTDDCHALGYFSLQ